MDLGNLCAYCHRREITDYPCPECETSLGPQLEYLKIILRTNQLHDPVSRLLPVEIVSRIFEMCVTYTLPPFWYMSEHFAFTIGHSPLALGSICRAWRKIAWSTPALWTFLEIDLDNGMFERPPPETLWPAGYVIVKSWLERTGCRPLKLRVFSNAVSSEAAYQLVEDNWGLDQLCFVIDLINAYSARWQYLDLSLPKFLLQRIAQQPLHGRPPILKTLRVKITDEDPSDQPSYVIPMRDLRPIEVRIDDIRYESLIIDWSNLTELYARDIYCDEVLNILANTPRLTHCDLSGPRGREDPTMPSTLPVVHHSLEKLTFRSEYVESHDFFSHLILPNIEFLEIESHLGNDTNLIACIRGFFRLSTASLQFLVLSLPAISLAEILMLLHEVPSLKKLLLSKDFIPEIWTVFFKSIGRWSSDPRPAVLLPNLEEFIIEHAADRGPSHEEYDIILETLQAASSDCDTNFCRDARKITIVFTMDVDRRHVSVAQINFPIQLKHLVGFSDLILAGMPFKIGLEAYANAKIKYLDFIGVRDELSEHPDAGGQLEDDELEEIVCSFLL